MAYVVTKGRFHVGIDGVGYILQGAPGRPGYRQDQASVYGQRFASGDRTYNDLSQWWYFAQTDWSGGFKDDPSWEDDGKFYYSTNIDTWSEPGSIKLLRPPQLDETFTEDITCGASGEVGGSQKNFIGTADGSGNRPLLYSADIGVGQTWTEVAGTTFSTARNQITNIFIKSGVAWVGSIGSTSDTTDIVDTYDGSTFTDQSGNITTVLTTSPTASRCAVTVNGVAYIFVDSDISNYWALVKTSVTNPTVGADFTLVFQRSSDTGLPIAAAAYHADVYYLLSYQGTYLELHKYSVADNVDVTLQTFYGTSSPTYGVGDKLLVEVAGKLVITIPSEEIWETDGDTLTRIFVRDQYKRDGLAVSEASCYLDYGAIVADAKAWWGNLMYDGQVFANTWKAADDLTTTKVRPLFTDLNGVKWHGDSVNAKKLYFYPTDSYNSGASFKNGSNKNFIVFSNHDKISGIDKLLYSVQHIFKTLASGHSIKLQYTTGELTSSTSWTDMDSAQFSSDGAITDKKILFPTPTLFKKVWFRLVLNTGVSDTTSPVVTDTVIEYLPMPAYKKQWQLSLNMSDEVQTLDGSLVENTARELRARLENSWWTKSVLDYQDLDYATTTLDALLSSAGTTVTVQVDGTLDFPEQGRIRIEDEEILYTGKTNTTFTGCTRGARGTRAVQHADDTVVNNAYKVLITELNAVAPILNEGKYLEYIVSVVLREV